MSNKITIMVPVDVFTFEWSPLIRRDALICRIANRDPSSYFVRKAQSLIDNRKRNEKWLPFSMSTDGGMMGVFNAELRLAAILEAMHRNNEFNF
jgi:hypothetical protein